MAEVDTAIPRFFRDKMQNNFRSQQEGRPVFDDVEKVEIIIPGMTQSIAVERVNEGHKMRWPNHYAAFQKGLEPVHDGTPLEEWPPLSPAQVANLKALQVHTVEQLANITDTAIQKIGMGARELKTKASAWLDQAKGGAALSQALAENAKLRDELETMKANHDQLAAAVARLSAQAGVG